MNAQTIPGRLSLLAPLFLSITLLSLQSASASTIGASAGSLGKAADNTKDQFTWVYNPPAAGTGITWIAGVDSEDSHDNPNPATTFGPEDYFGAGNTARAFNAFGKDPLNFGGALPAKSVATNSGGGASHVNVNQGTDKHTNYVADWHVDATGTLGNGPGNRNWHSFTQAKDPWNMNAADFIGITSPTYGLFFMSGIDSVDVSPAGNFDLDVFYQTAGFTMDLLNVGGGMGGVTVSVNPYPGLKIYQLTSENEGAADINTAALSAAQIQNLFQSITNTGQLASPVFLGLILDGLAIPTEDMGGGVLAAMNADTSVSDNAATFNPATPEPAAFLLIGSGLIGLAFYGRRRRQA